MAPIEYLKSLVPSSVREPLWRARAIPRRRLYTILRTVSPRDVATVLDMCFPRVARSTDPYAEVRLRGCPSPLILRRASSDFDVFTQVFLDRQYSGLPVRDVRTVVDAGANAGFSARFFLSRYPRARVIAVEPDERNIEVARRNLEGFEHRCTLVHGAIWGRSEQLTIARGTFRDGREWATQVSCKQSDSSELIAALCMRDLVDRYGLQTIDILKMDIEGSELEVFSSDDTEFLSRVRCCAIELHGQECADVFYGRARAYGFACRNRGEVTIAHR